MSTLTATIPGAGGEALAQEFEEIFREHCQFIYRSAYSVTGNRQDAEDVLQNIFVKLIEREVPSALMRNPKAYLYRAAVNLALNAVRTRKRSIAPGGTYLGVGPEQNFTYIAALRPKIAFIIDIRRDMMIEHLMYKAVFEMSADRADFVGNLFSRKRPAALTAESSVAAIFQAYAASSGDSMLAEAHLKDILTRLKTTHGFTLSADDERRLRTIYLTFLREGVLRFNSSIESPGYTALMTATDGQGRNWSFLSSTENYDRVRAMQQKNLIVPLVGDFGGPKTVRMTGQYLRDHGAIVNLFYLSNVEDYLQPVMQGYERNIASLPVDPSSLFIHLSLQTNGFRPWLTRISDSVRPRAIR